VTGSFLANWVRRIHISRSDALLVTLISALFVWAQFRSLRVTTLSDDAGLFYYFFRAVERGNLLGEAFAKFSAPIAQGGTIWRPLAWLTFAVDAALWGFNTTMWRLTNLGLYIAIAVGIAALVRRLGLTTRVACFAAGLWLLLPWSVETTVWIVGRYDLLATLGLVVSLWAILGSRGSDRALLVALIAYGLSLMSKESAMSFLPFIALALLIRPQSSNQSWKSRLFAGTRDLMPFLVMLAMYLLWRRHLFGDNVLGIYDQTSSLFNQGVWNWLAHAFAHFWFVTILFPSPRWYVLVASGCAALVIAFTICLAMKRRHVAESALLATLILIVSMIAIGFHFHAPMIASDGLRVYTVASVGLVLLCAMAACHRVGAGVLLVLIVTSAAMQREVNSRWWRASDSAIALTTQMRSVTAALPDSDYMLAIVPDRIGIVPFVRNAQGAMLTQPVQPWGLTTHAIFATNLQLTEWHNILEHEVVPLLTKRNNAPARPTQYACFDVQRNQVINLGFWPRTNSVEAWLAEWRERTRLACPEISKTMA
jgi:hypothetical protein